MPALRRIERSALEVLPILSQGGELVAAVVQIAIEIDDKGAVTGFDQLEKKVVSFGQKGSSAINEVTKRQHEAHQAGQLLLQTFGIHMPRTLEKIIAKAPGVSTALAGAFSAGVVISFIGAIAETVK